MTTYTIHNQDCLEAMAAMEANSIDAIVTDPPYGLVFMGKDWDHGVPGEHFWREAIRVAKPGAHLLAFGGTRTFHRLACAIEDAGWEMRDTLMWLYATGFPKSHNIGCGCGSSVVQSNDVEGKPSAQRIVRPVREYDVSSSTDTCKGRGEVLQPGLQEQGVPSNGASWPTSTPQGSEQSGLAGRGDVETPEGKLHRCSVRPRDAVGDSDGKGGRIHNGTPPCDGDLSRSAAHANGSRASHRPQPIEQPSDKPRTVPQQRGTQAGGGGACQTCGKLLDWKGYGTALKPAWEPIIMARKPIEGTVAKNVQRHGTGAINVDGCRVGGEPSPTAAMRASGRVPSSCKPGEYGNTIQNRSTPERWASPRAGEQLGRWPANVVHDGSDEVVAGFPGGAERFMYCAKASRADREEGCEDLDRVRVKMNNGNDAGGDPVSDRFTKVAANVHPTVKPTALMQWLVRMVTPPNGIVLDPFMGSGTTGKACAREGMRFIGCEMDADYAKIAEARIVHAYAQQRDAGGLFTV